MVRGKSSEPSFVCPTQPSVRFCLKFAKWSFHAKPTAFWVLISAWLVVYSLQTQTHFRLSLISARNNVCEPEPGSGFCDVGILSQSQFSSSNPRTTARGIHCKKHPSFILSCSLIGQRETNLKWLRHRNHYYCFAKKNRHGSSFSYRTGLKRPIGIKIKKNKVFGRETEIYWILQNMMKWSQAKGTIKMLWNTLSTPSVTVARVLCKGARVEFIFNYVACIWNMAFVWNLCFSGMPVN